MLNFVICEDSLNLLNKLSKMLESIFILNNYQAQISLKATSADEVLNYIKNNKTDVLLIDIKLNNHISGLELAEKVRNIDRDCYFIFVTGHLEYVQMAYQFKTFDYISKPITSERLEETIHRLFDDIIHLPKKYLRIDNKNTIIDQDEIQYIKRDGMKLVFHTNSRNYEAYSSFNKLQLDLPDNFVRCHKSYIANINKIENIEPVSNTIFFQNKSYCFIGPKYKSNLMEVINNYGNFK